MIWIMQVCCVRTTATKFLKKRTQIRGPLPYHLVRESDRIPPESSRGKPATVGTGPLPRPETAKRRLASL
jgi:hypothetical protein